ncbi:hypothetical protein LTR95_011294 [Oleoguttula sp. CCFEE 5521]
MSFRTSEFYGEATKIEAEEEDDADFDQVRDDHAPDAELISRRLGREVEEGADDIPGAVAQE